jgi:hypothetical protein
MFKPSWQNLSQRLKFTVLSAFVALFFAVAVHLFLPPAFKSQWIIIMAPLSTFISCYLLWRWKFTRTQWLFYSFPFCSLLTILTHFVYLFTFGIASVIAVGNFHPGDLIQSVAILLIAVLPYGLLHSLWMFGIPGFLIFLITGTFTVMTADQPDIITPSDKKE